MRVFPSKALVFSAKLMTSLPVYPIFLNHKKNFLRALVIISIEQRF